MKKEVLFVLLDQFADWEGAFLASALNTGLEITGGGTDFTARTLSPSAQQVRSLGGLTVTTDYTLENMPAEYAGLILVGGTGWRSEKAERVVPVVEAALTRGIPIGAICNATLFLGEHGFLNEKRHTSNTLPLLLQWAGEQYTGEALYEERQAVRDGNLVTANGTGSLEFMRECLKALGAGSDEQIDAYYMFNKHGFCTE